MRRLDAGEGATGEDATGEGATGHRLPPKTEPEVKEILAHLRAGLEELYGDRLRGLHLYGSYARGEAVSGSDLDVLVVLDEVESSWEEIRRTSELTAALSLDHEVTVSRVFAPERKWEAGETPFLRAVRREAIPV